MTVYLTPYDADRRECLDDSTALPCETLDEAKALMGAPVREYAAMLFYPGMVVSRARLAIDVRGNSAHNGGDNQTNEQELTQ